MAEPGEFLARWSRLKQKAGMEPARRQAITEPEVPAAVTVPTETKAPIAEPPVLPPRPELPPIESLSKDSDYLPFLRPEVPEELRREALRKLWQSDPVFANLDGLLEYGEDFGEPFRLVGAVATVYRVLKGMVGDEPPPNAAVETLPAVEAPGVEPDDPGEANAAEAAEAGARPLSPDNRGEN